MFNGIKLMNNLMYGKSIEIIMIKKSKRKKNLIPGWSERKTLSCFFVTVDKKITLSYR